MANDEYEGGDRDRLTMSEFAELIQHLSVQDILIIEYRIGTSWNRLYARKNTSAHIFFCNLCFLETSSFKNLLAHIDGRKHKLQMERVDQLYHPSYTYPKNEKKEPVEKPGIKQKDVTINVQTLDDNEIGQLASIGEGKPINIKSETINVPSKLNDCVPIAAAVVMQNKLCKGDTSSDDKNEEGNAHGGVSGCNNSEELAQKQDVKPKANEEIFNIQTTSNQIKSTKKRSLVNNNCVDVDLKKRKLVLNPAASLKLNSMKAKDEAKEESSKKPKYETDKVIIPTVHKSKSHNDKDSKGSILQKKCIVPEFSVKSYSSNANENEIYGILGVEYVIKILKSRCDVSPRYECGLCELVFDGFAMQKHLEGYNHRLKFCEKHFPTAIRQYRQYMQNVPEHEVFKVMAPVLAKLARAIEQHHGRNLPYECYEREFSLNRHEILAKAFSCRHASEQYGPAFTHVVGSKEVDEFINNRQNYAPPPFSRTLYFDIKPDVSNNRQQKSRNADSQPNSRDRHFNAVRENKLSADTAYKPYMSSSLNEDAYPPSKTYTQDGYRNITQHVDDETYNLMVDDFLKGTLKGLPRTTALHDNRKRSLSPSANFSYGNRKSLSPLRQNDIWQAYRHMVDQKLYDLDERFKQYRKDPETHPCYNEEWQKFWKRRKDELVLAGLDHRKYNYQPEWVRFVKIRIEEMYGQEVENIKIKCRERLCLPLSNDNISDVKYHVQGSKLSSSNELTSVHNTDPNTLLPNSSILSHPSNNSGPPLVVSVLRLMTALEDSLGSLGPKIIDLLSKALQTEKINPVHVNAIILNDENCSLIETAKEKLKGMVITGLFEGSKKRVLNQVVTDAESLLQYAYQYKHQLLSERSSIEVSVNRGPTNASLTDSTSGNIFTSLNQPNQGTNTSIKKSQSSKVENILTHVDKKELASKLAASLVAQGKTDFDPQQLQQLIAVYKLIEKKKRGNTGTMQSSSGYFSLQEPGSSNKKTLSDTLSDLLKPSTSPEHAISDVSESVHTLQRQLAGNTQFPSIPSNAYETRNPSNSSDNYFNNAAQLVSNSFGASGGGGHFEQRTNYGMNYTSNLSTTQQNSTYMYNNQYQNANSMPQNFQWNSNMEMNQNYSMGGRSNRFNPGSSWQHF